MNDVANLMTGLSMAFRPDNILWIFIGVMLGMTAGTLPGIGASTMVAILLPLVYKMPADRMVLAIIGIYSAGIYSGNFTGILFNIPGEPGSIPTTIEGYRCTLKGKTTDALAAAAGASLFGNTFGVLCMIGLLPLFQYIITFFGSAEKALLGLLALVLICTGILTKDDPFKGLGGLGIGLFLGCVGVQGNTGEIRYALTIPNLWDGVHIIWLVMGLFAIPQLMQLPSMKDALRNASRNQGDKKAIIESPFVYYKKSFSAMKEHFGMILRGSLIGTIIGIIPGIGAMTAGWVAYANAQAGAKHKEEIGQGSVEAIACIEASNNAALPGALIPMFSLGIPGSGSAAIIMSVFIMAGLNPGPQMMDVNGDLIWTIIFGFVICGLAFFSVSYLFRIGAGSLLILPVHWMVVVLGPLVILGCYVAKNDALGSVLALLIALIALFLVNLGVPTLGVLLGVVLGSLIETETIRALQVGGIGRFMRPFPIILAALIVFVFGFSIYKNYLSKGKGDKQKAAPMRMVGQGDDEELVENAEGEVVAQKIDPERINNADIFQRLIFSIFLFVFGAVCFVQTNSFKISASAVWPRFVFIVMMFFPAAVMLVQVIFQRHRIKDYFQDKRAHKMSKPAKEKLWDQIIIFVAIVIGTVLIPYIGMVWSCAVFGFIVTLYMTKGKVLPALLAFAIVMGFMWVVRTAMGIYVPKGPFGI